MPSSIFAAALAFGVGALAFAPASAETQMHPACVSAVESEVREQYPQTVSVEATALESHRVSGVETVYSGTGEFEDESGARTSFLFDCIANARAGEAYGVLLRGARQQPRAAQSASGAAVGAPIGTRTVAPAIVEAGPATEASESGEDPSALLGPEVVQIEDVALPDVAANLPESQIAVLRYAAQASAAASVCANVELNEQAVVATLANVMQAMSLQLTPEQAASHRDAALIAYGFLTGQMLQNATADRTAFCADASRTAGGAQPWSFMRVKDDAEPTLGEVADR